MKDFLTVNQRNPHHRHHHHQDPEKLYSTYRTRVWRIPGESLEPVYDPFPTSSEFTLPAAVMTQTCGVFVEQVVFLTVNHRGPLPLKELHSTDETWVWRDPGGSWACLRPASDYEWRNEPNRFPITSELALPEAVTQTCMWQLCAAGRFTHSESPRTPSLKGTSLHRRNMCAERPWEILSLFTTRFRLRVNSPCQRLWHRHVWGVFVKQVP